MDFFTVSLKRVTIMVINIFRLEIIEKENQSQIGIWEGR